MYEIYFYRNKHGKEPAKEYLIHLASRKDKDSRIKLNKIRDYVKILSECGTQIGEPYVKHLDGDDIWEIRPLKDRILFAAWHNGSYILLHHFVKKTRKTPIREIEKARQEYADIYRKECRL